MDQRWVKRSRNTVCVLFLMVLIMITVGNRNLFLYPLADWICDGDFRKMTEEIPERYTGKQVSNRFEFINLNGMFARISGRTSYNSAQLMNNGMLFYGSLNRPDTAALADSMISFRDDLADLGIPFLFVAAPYKNPLTEELLPEDVSVPRNLTNSGMNELLSRIRQEGVLTVDLREKISATREQVEQYFYRTDQHWNGDGAFLGYQILMEELHRIIPDINGNYKDGNLWERHEIPGQWLGSFGKKVGSRYTGKDSLIYYTPAFETDMSFAVPKHNWFRKGSFEEALIQEKYIDEKDYFNYNAYCVYIGGDYPIAVHRNRQAPNVRRLLLIKDSFMLPMESFLSTEFTEITVIDPRYYQDSEIREYVLWNRPDLVLMMINPSSLSAREYADFGMSIKGLGIENALIWKESKMSILPGLSEENSCQISMALENGKTYKITVDRAVPTNGDIKGFSMELYNKSLYLKERGTIFDLDFCNEYGYSWTIRVPEDGSDYCLLIYAGVRGETQDNGLDLYDLLLFEMTEIGMTEEGEAI